MKISRVMIGAALMAQALMAHTLMAQTRAAGGAGEVPRAARVVINTVMSPYCPGLLLANCPSPSADSLRRAIVARAARGATESELLADLIATYGEVVRAEPAMRGFGAVAWVAPFAAILAVGVAIGRWLRGQRRQTVVVQVAPETVAAPGDDERLRRVEALVRRGV